MGDRWLKRVTKHAAQAGNKTLVEDQPGLNSAVLVAHQTQSSQKQQCQWESRSWATSSTWAWY
eukprot:12908047-Prorocentrum_lima.AAC.1